MLKHILPLIPEHRIYTEAFFGGGAVFFGKIPSESEVINDTNSMAITFYKVCKTEASFNKLKEKIEATPFSRATYKVACCIYQMPHLFNKLQCAWAFYVGTNMGFSCQIGSWGFDKYSKRVLSFNNKKLAFDARILKRLEDVQIECKDACAVIQQRDTVDTFHYVDPPYINVHQGHYSGYSQEDYINLLDTLSTLKGKFLLSSYPTEFLTEYTKKYGWQTKTFDKPLSAQKAVQGKVRGRKTEVLTANYLIDYEEKQKKQDQKQ